MDQEWTWTGSGPELDNYKIRQLGWKQGLERRLTHNPTKPVNHQRSYCTCAQFLQLRVAPGGMKTRQDTARLVMNLLKLPPEVVLTIFFYVNGNDFKNAQRVCKEWNNFIQKWILKNPRSRHPYKINQNWMSMKPGYKQTELRCKEREKWTYNLLAAGNGIFVMNLDQPHYCGIFTGDKMHEHRVDHNNGGSYALISDKLIIITYDGDGTDENDLWPERRDILERLEDGEVCVRATNQRFVAHEMKCDREYFVIQENDEKAEEDVKMLSLYKLEKEKIRKVSTENLAVNFKLMKFKYPYIQGLP